MINDKALFPGSFNPFHNGHLEVLAKASSIFSNVIIYVANNEEKEYFREIEERVELIKLIIEAHELTNVEVIGQKPEELTPLFTKENKIKFIIRGIKNDEINDYENELMKKYKSYNSNLDFFYINTNLQVSSTLINEKLANNEDISNLVSDSILEKLI